VAEAKTNVIQVSGFLIRVSKETLLTLNVSIQYSVMSTFVFSSQHKVCVQHKDAEYRSLCSDESYYKN